VSQLFEDILHKAELEYDSSLTSVKEYAEPYGGLTMGAQGRPKVMPLTDLFSKHYKALRRLEVVRAFSPKDNV
jgi:hypothetical protein